MELTNPYQAPIDEANSKFYHGMYDNIWNGGKRRYELEVARQNWEAQVQMMNYQNWYNSPIQQASRIRAAGGNPDLVGFDAGGQSASGSGAATLVNGPEKSFGENMMSAVGTAASVASTFLGGAGAIIGMAGKVAQNRILDNEVVKSNIELASLADRYDYELPTQSARNLQQTIRGSAPQLAKHYADIDTLNKVRKETAKSSIIGTADGVMNLADMKDKDMQEVFSILAEYDYEIEKARLDNLPFLKEAEKQGYLTATSQSHYSQDYYDAMDGSSVAGYERTMMRSNSEQLDLKRQEIAAYKKAMDKLEKKADDGSVWASLGMFLVPKVNTVIDNFVQVGSSAAAGMLGGKGVQSLIGIPSVIK